mmetsp:Transcript_16230/g.35698  ORF Transcript_16230/g.35698 Transcript_16230/m.35698 type:complete len:241 (+) Transcript_16230:325-1047(+)
MSLEGPGGKSSSSFFLSFFLFLAFFSSPSPNMEPIIAPIIIICICICIWSITWSCTSPPSPLPLSGPPHGPLPMLPPMPQPPHPHPGPMLPMQPGKAPPHGKSMPGMPGILGPSAFGKIPPFGPQGIAPLAWKGGIAGIESGAKGGNDAPFATAPMLIGFGALPFIMPGMPVALAIVPGVLGFAMFIPSPSPDFVGSSLWLLFSFCSKSFPFSRNAVAKRSRAQPRGSTKMAFLFSSPTT